MAAKFSVCMYICVLLHPNLYTFMWISITSAHTPKFHTFYERRLLNVGQYNEYNDGYNISFDSLQFLKASAKISNQSDCFAFDTSNYQKRKEGIIFCKRLIFYESHFNRNITSRLQFEYLIHLMCIWIIIKSEIECMEVTEIRIMRKEISWVVSLDKYRI